MPITNKRAVAVTNPRGDRTVATNIDQKLRVKFDALCKERGVTRSALLHSLIEHEVDEQKRCTHCGFVLDLRWKAEFDGTPS